MLSSICHNTCSTLNVQFSVRTIFNSKLKTSDDHEQLEFRIKRILNTCFKIQTLNLWTNLFPSPNKPNSNCAKISLHKNSFSNFKSNLIEIILFITSKYIDSFVPRLVQFHNQIHLYISLYSSTIVIDNWFAFWIYNFIL